MAKDLLSRKDVPVEETWDLSLIYPTEDAFKKDLEELQITCDEIVRDYQGKLDTPEHIVECLEKYERVYELMTLLVNYTDLAVSVDYYDQANMQRNDRTRNIIRDMEGSLSFIDSEIIEQSEEVLKLALAQAGSCKGYIKELLRKKPHQMHPEAERVLTTLSGALDLPYDAYNTAKLADMKFDAFDVDGEKYPLGYSLFEDNYEYEPNTKVRRAAFEAFSAKLRDYENTNATLYNSFVQTQKTLATLRGFKSIYDKDLFEDHVNQDLYHRQINLITEKLAPHMRKYAALIKKIYHLDEMTFADLKLPIDPDYCPTVSIEESKAYIEKGLSVMGEDYLKMIQTAYRERWVDFAQNKGKSTGGFCASPYGKGSFILLTWQGKMSDVFTLAHELGHAGHFKLCNEAQSIFDTNVSGYFVEAPSTMNELLMVHYMLKTNDDKRFRRWVLANMVSNTYYHNFVTHLMEAAYQREVYKIVDEGGSVQAETLNQIMREALEKFWGDTVKINEGAELTWMRQPHYYMGLYSYSYSAGLTIATQMCKRIENEGESAIEDWKNVLQAGSTLSPVELAALGGIDITTDGPLLDTIETIGAYIDEICKLTEELEAE
jgi:oligoendopeptidase F